MRVGRILDVEVPRKLRSLERDPRGYPIPFIVYRESNGRPHFTINEATRATFCARRGVCALCGKRLVKDIWFVGGARCFTDEMGAFIDPAGHLDCLTYALQVCPFLAAPSYARRIEDAKMSKEGRAEAVIMVNSQATLNQPTCFGLGKTTGWDIVRVGPGDTVLVPEPWVYVEWWKDGQRCNAPPVDANGVAVP